MTDTLARMRQLIGSTAEWAANDIILGYGELGIERVSASEYKAKAGDGTAKWSALPYLTASGTNIAPAVQAALDGKVAKAGDTLTGPLILSRDGLLPLEPATTSQLTNALAPINTAVSGKVSRLGDTMTGTLALHADPVSAMEAATKQYVDNEDTQKVDKAGDTMTGILTLSGNPTNPLEAATKEYVDNGSYQTIVGGTSTYSGKVVKLNAQGLIDNSLFPVTASYLGAVNLTAPYSLTGTYLPGNYFSVAATGTIDLTWSTKLNAAPTLCSAGQFIIYNANGRFDLVGEASSTINLDSKLDKSGGTLTGPLVLYADPTTAMEPATKQYADKMVPKAGGTMTGLLVLSADPAAALGAATKQYVDNKVGTVTGFVAKAGDTMTGPLTLSGDATAALQAVTKQQVEAIDTANRTAWAAGDAAITTAYQTAVGNRVNKSGDTMTGALTLSGDPTTALHAATKQYVDGLDTASRSTMAAADAAIQAGYQAADAGKVAKAGDVMSGNLEIGNGAPYLRLHHHGLVWWNLQTGGDGSFNIQNNGGTYALYSVNGSLHVPGDVIAFWSDRRLKEEIQPLDGYEARIMGLRPVSFQWNEKGQKLTGRAEGHREIGFIAQDVKAISDQFVGENKTADAPEGEDPYLTVRKDEMIADLVAMVQSLNQRLLKIEGKL